MTTRPLVQIHTPDGKGEEQIQLPAVFQVPIRADVVHNVHTSMAKNKRQPYAVSRHAGEQTSAESWGTGRAVARIPRVPGGGTHRAGQGAFGNMCRGGRMFAPTKIWRRWHRKINVAQKRFALTSALAGTAVPALVMARGHRIEEVPEIPLVISNASVETLSKTKEAVALLQKIGALDDVEKVKDSHKVRPGRGKQRNRRYVQRRGPLIIYYKKGSLVNAFRNIPGIEVCSVERLNLLQLAPGGHLGRFVIWTKDAFQRLDSLYGTFQTPSAEKKGFLLPRGKVTNADLNRIINSDEIQSHLRPVSRAKKYHTHKKNPLVNRGAMIKLNPFETTRLRRQIKAEQRRKTQKKDLVAKKRGTAKQLKKAVKARKANGFYKTLLSNPRIYEGAPAAAQPAKTK